MMSNYQKLDEIDIYWVKKLKSQRKSLYFVIIQQDNFCKFSAYSLEFQNFFQNNFFLKVGQNNFGKKIPFFTVYIIVGNGPYPDKLRYVGLPILPPGSAECFKNTKLYLCAGSRLDGKGICDGDSGGPLVVPRSKSDNTAVVIGVSSFGTSDSNGNCRLSVFAPVTSVLKWIKPKMGKP